MANQSQLTLLMPQENSAMNRKFSRRNDHNAPTNKQQKQRILEGKRLLKNRDYLGAAECYKQAGMMREAIDILEHNGFIKEAGGVLISMGHHARAGYVLARNKHFQEACDAFMKAGMYMEAATAAKSAANYSIASKLFLQAKQPIAAAGCFIKLKDFLSAARCFASSGGLVNAGKCYKVFIKMQPRKLSLLQDSDRHNIYRCLLSNDPSVLLTRGLRNTDLFARLVLHHMTKDHTKMVIFLLKQGDASDHNRIMSIVNYSQPYPKTLAQCFLMANKPEYAGFIYEKIGNLPKAAEAFEAAGIRKRALTLYRQTANAEAVRRLTNKAPPTEPAATKILARQSDESPKSQKASSLPPAKAAPAQSPGNDDGPSVRSCQNSTPPKSYYLANLFMALTRLDCDILWEFGMIRNLKKGELLYDGKTPADFMAIILKGKLQIHKPGEAVLEESDCLGELALMSTISQTLQVSALTTAEIYCVNHDEFMAFADENGYLAQKISQTFLSNLVEDNPSIMNVA